MTEAQRGEQRRRQSKAKRRRVSLSMKVLLISFQLRGEQVFALLGECFVQFDWFYLPLHNYRVCLFWFARNFVMVPWAFRLVWPD